jgi:hypothetical protein
MDSILYSWEYIVLCVLTFGGPALLGIIIGLFPPE